MSLCAQRFASAMDLLVGDGPIKQRLASAYALYLAELSEADLPPALLRDFSELRAALTRVAPVGHETPVRASVQKMSPNEAAAHAGTILRLHVALASGLERAEQLKVVAAPRKAPRYLAGRQ